MKIHQHVPVATALALAALAPHATPQNTLVGAPQLPLFEMIDIGDLGGPSSMALDIDEQGTVVGEADTVHLRRHAYVWTLAGGIAPLDDAGAGLASSAWALNEQGLQVGYARDVDWHFRPVLWQGGLMQDLGTLGGPEGFALDINAHGVIVGTADSQAWGHPRAFVHDGGMTALPTPDYSYGTAFGINDAGTIVGKTGVVNGEHAARWRHAPDADGWLFEDLHPSRGTSSGARAINEQGDIVGWSQLGAGGADPGTYRGCLWRHTGPVVDLGTLAGMRTSTAYGLNAHVEVVGTTGGEYPLADRAFYWSAAHGMHDLNDMTANAEGRHIVAATGINDAGDIIGYVDDHGTPRGVYLRRVE